VVVKGFINYLVIVILSRVRNASPAWRTLYGEKGGKKMKVEVEIRKLEKNDLRLKTEIATAKDEGGSVIGVYHDMFNGHILGRVEDSWYEISLRSIVSAIDEFHSGDTDECGPETEKPEKEC
jgi:hypothetical protein